VSWLDRLRTRPTEATGPEGEPGEEASAAFERASPGLAALFGVMKPERAHSILDLGEASRRHLAVLSPYARQIRFAGLVPTPPAGDALRVALERLPPNADHPYDIVLAWDVLDRLGPPDRKALLERVTKLTAPGARLYASVDTSGAETIQPVRWTLVSVDRISQEPVGAPERAKPVLLPAQAERMLDPFKVTHAFSLRVGAREYVATRG